MEISDRELRRLVATVDDAHRDGMRTMGRDIAELHATTRPLRTTRRRFLARAGLGAGIGAGVVTIGSAAIPFGSLLGAAAQEEEEGLSDAALAGFAESLELTAVAAYSIAAPRLPSPLAQAGSTFAAHHGDHARAFAALAGGEATGQANAKLLGNVADQLANASEANAVLQVLLDVENAAAGTYLFALGELEDEAALKVAASILPVEAQHAVVIGQAMGKPLDAVVPPFENQDRAVDPTKFPTTTATSTTTTTER